MPEQSAQGAPGSAALLLPGLQLVLALVLLNKFINAKKKKDRRECV